jgi:hypothetical protein
MTDHIYGRTNIVDDVNRPNVFIAELGLYIDFLNEQLENDYSKGEPDVKRKKYYLEFFKNLQEGILYYKNLPMAGEPNRASFAEALDIAANKLDALICQYSIHLPEKIVATENTNAENNMVRAN